MVLHKPVSLPSRSIVAMAWDTASCRYPFSSPMTRSCFGDDTADWAVAEDCATQTLQSATIVTKNASRRGTMVWPITSANLTAVQPASQSPQRAGVRSRRDLTAACSPAYASGIFIRGRTRACRARRSRPAWNKFPLSPNGAHQHGEESPGRSSRPITSARLERVSRLATIYYQQGETGSPAIANLGLLMTVSFRRSIVPPA